MSDDGQAPGNRTRVTPPGQIGPPRRVGPPGRIGPPGGGAVAGQSRPGQGARPGPAQTTGAGESRAEGRRPDRFRRSSIRTRRAPGLDVPLENRRALVTPRVDPEFFGKLSERFARFMGTARFIFYMTVFVGVWLAWNTFAPASLQFDPRALNYTLLTLILSLQASYAAPLILLAQNRQDDRDRVSFEQDRQRAERSLADTEYLAREIVSLRIALRDVATRDFVRSELRDLVAELLDERAEGSIPGSRSQTRDSDRPEKPVADRAE
jgi:uncharacterized membrane protein